MQPSSEAYEIEDRCFRVSVARRLMLSHLVAANPADVVQFCPNKSAAGVICNKPLDSKQHHCYGCQYGGVDRRHAAVARCLADIIHSHSGVKVFIEREVPALPVLSTDRLNTLGWILSLTFMVQSRIWTFLSLRPSLAIRLWFLLPAQNQDLWPRERRRPNLIGTHTSIWSRSFLRQQDDLVHMPRSSLTICCEMLTIHQLLSETPGPPSKVSSAVPSPNNNLWLPLRDSWGLLLSPSCQLHIVFCLRVPATRKCTQPFSVSKPLQLCHVVLL